MSKINLPKFTIRVAIGSDHKVIITTYLDGEDVGLQVMPIRAAWVYLSALSDEQKRVKDAIGQDLFVFEWGNEFSWRRLHEAFVREGLK